MDSERAIILPSQLRGQGYRFTRLQAAKKGDNKSGKKPIDGDMYSLNGTFSDTDPRLLDHIHKGNGYGIVCNFGMLAVFDLDSIEALDLVPRLPKTFADSCGNVSRHYFFKCNGLKKKLSIYHPIEKDADGRRKKIADVQAGMAHLVGPGSPNWRGGTRKIIDESPIATITLAELKEILKGYAFAPTGTKSFEEAIAQRSKPINRVNMYEILEHFKWEPTVDGGNDWKGYAPCHHSESGTCLAIDPENEVWYCHSCGAGGDKGSLALLLHGDINCTEHKKARSMRSTVKDIVREIKGEPEITQDNWPCTEGGNATRLTSMFKNDIRYCPQTKLWYIWDGNRWKADTASEISQKAEAVVAYLYTLGEDYQVFAQHSDTLRGIKNMIAIASARKELIVHASDLDKDPTAMTFPGATLYFSSQKGGAPGRRDMITKLGGCDFDRDAKAPRWVKFIDEVFPSKELQRYVQKAVGYSFSGNPTQKCFFYCDDSSGIGDNGKSVFLNVLRKVAGEYGHHANINTFLRRRDGADIRDDLVNLRGMRFVTSVEPDESAVFDMELLKAWTGRDKVRCRSLYQKEIEYTPCGVLWMAGNNRPIIKETTMAAWNRLRVIPFLVCFKDKMDPHLEDKLVAESSGILNWIIEGYKLYVAEGLEEPDLVRVVKKDYRESCNSIEAFLSAACIVAPGVKVRSSEVKKAYEAFCVDEGLFKFGPRKLKQYLTTCGKGIVYKREMDTTYFKGMLLHATAKKDELDAVKEFRRCATPLSDELILQNAVQKLGYFVNELDLKSLLEEKYGSVVELPTVRRVLAIKYDEGQNGWILKDTCQEV